MLLNSTPPVSTRPTLWKNRVRVEFAPNLSTPRWLTPLRLAAFVIYPSPSGRGRMRDFPYPPDALPANNSPLFGVLLTLTCASPLPPNPQPPVALGRCRSPQVPPKTGEYSTSNNSDSFGGFIPDVVSYSPRCDNQLDTYCHRLTRLCRPLSNLKSKISNPFLLAPGAQPLPSIRNPQSAIPSVSLVKTPRRIPAGPDSPNCTLSKAFGKSFPEKFLESPLRFGADRRPLRRGGPIVSRRSEEESSGQSPWRRQNPRPTSL